MNLTLCTLISLCLAVTALPDKYPKRSSRIVKKSVNKISNSTKDNEIIKNDALTHLRLLSRSSSTLDQSRLRYGIPVTDPAKYPYIVSIQIPSANMIAGVAVIISKYCALTTGENVEAIENLLPITKLISNSLVVQIGGTDGVQHDISKVKKHEQFVTGSNINNVGIIKVCPPFIVACFATLPPNNKALELNQPTNPGHIAAWAADGSVLYEFEINVDSDNNCAQTDFNDAPNQYCNVVEGPSPICETADTGTPWFVQDTVVGLANTAHCTQRKADVFVDVGLYVNWITNACKI